MIEAGLGQAEVFRFARGHLPRALASLIALAAFGWLLADRMARIDQAALALAFSQVGPGQWLAAVCLTIVSFWAVGRYDAVIHRHLATGLPAGIARRSGIAAIAVSQMTGLGLMVGTILRWRMLPGIALPMAARLTIAVAVSFLAGWAVVTAVVLLLLPEAPFKPLAALTLVLAALAFGLCLWRPALPLRHLRWPNSFTLFRLVALCGIDTGAAALAFHALCPPGTDLVLLLPAFLLALGAGLISGTPGGMGAFELTLLALLPPGDDTGLMATVLAWRLVYFVLPSLVGVGLALVPPLHTPARLPGMALRRHLPAEIGLARQGRLSIAQQGSAQWLSGRTGHLRVAFFGPLDGRSPADQRRALCSLEGSARAEGLMPVVYKADARLAALARTKGRTVRRLGREAELVPAADFLTSPTRATLRRKLRRAAAAGVTVQPATADTAPWPALDRLAQDWALRHGGERGFSMGQFDRSYLAGQRLYIAWAMDEPIAFASFHATAGEWTLDLMRHRADLPDGTMHSLITAALFDAAREGVARMSLAAVPEGPWPQGGWLNRRLAPKAACHGLFQFKSSFAPTWRPLYLITPNTLALPLAALSLWRAIHRPGPLMPEIERDDEEYGFASAPASWHIAE